MELIELLNTRGIEYKKTNNPEPKVIDDKNKAKYAINLVVSLFKKFLWIVR